MVRQHFENTIKQIQADKERQISIVKDRVTRDVIIPHSNEVNQSSDRAIAELTAQLQSDIAKLQEKFAIDKQALIDIGEKNKTDFSNTTLSTEIAIVSAQYDQAIKDLEALIAKIKE